MTPFTDASFQARIPTLSDDQLLAYVGNHLHYREDAVRLALAELRRRGVPVPVAWIRSFEAHLAKEAEVRTRSRVRASGRMRTWARATMVAGLAASLAVLLMNLRPPAPDAGLPDPMDSKRYVRELEMYGGKINVTVVAFNRWFDSLWQGRNLACSLAVLTLLMSGTMWLFAGKVRPSGDAPSGDGEGGPRQGQ